MKIIGSPLLLLLCLLSACSNAQQTIFTKKAIIPNAIHESSGIEYTDGKVWTFNDSGNPPTIYSIDSTTGAILQQVTITNFANTDWEDITADDDYIYLGDFGNNDGNRKDLKILKIAKADIGTASSVSVTAQAINFSYPDQTTFLIDDKNNFDCESLIALGDSLYLFTKNHGDLQSRLYSLPKVSGSYAANFISKYDVAGKITGATINPSKNQVALLGYQSSHFGSFILFLDNFTGNDFFSGTKNRKYIIDTNVDWQTEGITYVNNERLFITCESTTAFASALYAADYAVINSHVLSVPKNTKPTGALVYPNPSIGSVIVTTDLPAIAYSIYNMLGTTIHQQVVENGTNTPLLIDLSKYPNGVYMIEVKTAIGSYFEKIMLEK